MEVLVIDETSHMTSNEESMLVDKMSLGIMMMMRWDYIGNIYAHYCLMNERLLDLK